MSVFYVSWVNFAQEIVNDDIMTYLSHRCSRPLVRANSRERRSEPRQPLRVPLLLSLRINCTGMESYQNMSAYTQISMFRDVQFELVLICQIFVENLKVLVFVRGAQV